MKANERRQEGSVLTVILVMIVLIGITLASYLNLVSNQNQSILRSQQWNAAIPVAEAGIEEALAHLNKNGTNRLTDGWTLAVDGTNIVKERVIGDAKYRVLVNFLKEPPVVLAQGFVKLPGQSTFASQPRTIQTGTRINPLFTKGLVAKGMIDLKGNNIRTDSFDSTDPNFSNGGVYDSSRNKDGGDVATNGQLVNVGNANVLGKVSTGPGGTVNVGSNGKVGSKAWHAAGNNGKIQPGWVRDDMNVEFPDVEVPFTTGFSIGLSGGNRTVGSGNYVENGNLSLSGGAKFVVTGHAKVYVKGSVSFSGSAYIEIQPGASLELFVGGSSTSIGGNGIMNLNNTASSFAYWGLNSNTSVSLGGNAAFTGTLYAPYASLSMGGGGNNTYDVVGAAVVNTVKMNGHFNFHYDEALGKFGPKIGYLIDSWNETAGWVEI